MLETGSAARILIKKGMVSCRNVLLMNSLSSPTYMPSNIERSAERSAAHGSLEQDFRESLERSSDIYQQQVTHPPLTHEASRLCPPCMHWLCGWHLASLGITRRCLIL